MSRFLRTCTAKPCSWPHWAGWLRQWAGEPLHSFPHLAWPLGSNWSNPELKIDHISDIITNKRQSKCVFLCNRCHFIWICNTSWWVVNDEDLMRWWSLWEGLDVIPLRSLSERDKKVLVITFNVPLPRGGTWSFSSCLCHILTSDLSPYRIRTVTWFRLDVGVEVRLSSLWTWSRTSQWINKLLLLEIITLIKLCLFLFGLN